MTLTRAQVETILIRRCGRLLTACSLDGTTVSGANADLNDPIGQALRQLGYSVTTITNVSDADLALVSESKTDHLLDLAELRTLESALENLDATDITVGSRSEKLNQLGTRLETAITRKTTQITARYGAIRPSLSPYAGGISRSDKETREADTDRVAPAFSRALHTNLGSTTTTDGRLCP